MSFRLDTFMIDFCPDPLVERLLSSPSDLAGWVRSQVQAGHISPKNGSTLECELTCIGSIPLLGAAILFSIVNAKRNRNKFLANVETRKGLQLVFF